jgi:peptidoglycan/LPS O-acetylase OafA/YrhL
LSSTIGSETAEQPQRKHSAPRLRSLDGLRAISILLVLNGHLIGTRGYGRPHFGIGDQAHLGVVVFFVISGLLITSLLMSERQRNGSVSLKLFYARRSVRIFPAAFAYLTILALLWTGGVISLHARDMWYAVTYTVNFQPHVSWHTGHLWSLSVEEQFYVLWPLTFVLLSQRRAAIVTVGVMMLAPAARIFNRFVLVDTDYHGLNMFPMVADSLAMGCMLALMRGWLEEQRWYLRLFHPVPSLALLVLVLLLNRYMGFTVVRVFGSSIINLGLAILIHRSVYCSRDVMGRFLNWRPLAFVGVLSYSLYVWQQLFLNRSSPSWMCEFPQNLLFTFSAALASYYLLEKPLLRLRQRLRT